MKRLIIVSPHFPPINAADHQRVRIALPYLSGHGWSTEVIAVAPQDVSASEDAFLSKTIPDNISVQRVRVPSGLWTRIPGMGNLGYRSKTGLGRALTKAINRARRDADTTKTVIYFSTTQFPVHGLIPHIIRDSSIKIAMDFQDRWVNDYYQNTPDISPPGGKIKYQIDRWLACRTERRVLPRLDGFTQVSSRYGEELNNRYPFLRNCPRLTIPFGAAESDFRAVRESGIKQSQFASSDGLKHWLYIGRCGPDMGKSLRGFFRALKQHEEINPSLESSLRIHFIGTSYATGNRAQCHAIPIANTEGVGHLVCEKPLRIPYGETLRCLLDADALIVPGSDDVAYNASKLFPYILANRPLLSVFHGESPVSAAMKNLQAGCSVTFNSLSTVDQISKTIQLEWFERKGYQQVPEIDWEAFAQYTARDMTRQLSLFLDSI